MMKHHPAPANGAHSHRTREDERGSISPYLCIASGLLTMVALLVMLSLGDATLHRRDASNAADSAALAAAGAWADSIESAYDDAVGAGNADDLWGGVGNGVGSYAGPKARRAAETYASRNGATVTAYSVDATRRTITVAVETNSAVEGVDERMTAESTAEIVLGNGVCLKGGKIGFTMDGRCVAKRPDEDPAPESTPSPSPTTAPFKVPDGMSEHARVTTRLVS
ncbi:pilus assembly protein TadG-related protein [Actinomyces gerencseriae]|uniref:pilus assembly protein TadG-related protein n=1 Tax=Actinomyces gerencseriae TaxID=52769 RepID=UPI0003FC3724|nr:pilus assembly protein TadG-related protein [Actinomyces gerencseriae]